MSEDLVREILAKGEALVASLAQQLGQTAAHVYGVIVKQQVVEGISSILWGVFSLLFVLFLANTAKNIYKKVYAHFLAQDGNSEGDAVFAGALCAGVIAFIMFMVWPIIATSIIDGIKKVINPEYYAIEFLLDQVKPQENK